MLLGDEEHNCECASFAHLQSENPPGGLVHHLLYDAARALADRLERLKLRQRGDLLWRSARAALDKILRNTIGARFQTTDSTHRVRLAIELARTAGEVRR